MKPTANLTGKTINIYLRKILSTPLPVPLHARTYTVTRALLNTILQTKQGCGTRKTFDGFDSGFSKPNLLRPCFPLWLRLRAKYPSDFGGFSSKTFPSGNFARFQRRYRIRKRIQDPVASKAFLRLSLLHIPSLQSAINNASLEVGEC